MQHFAVLAGATPCNFVARLAFWKVGQFWRSLPVVEELVHRHFERSRELFERLNRRYRMSVFNATDVATKQARLFLNVSLRQALLFSKRPQPISYNHILSLGVYHAAPEPYHFWRWRISKSLHASSSPSFTLDFKPRQR